MHLHLDLVGGISGDMFISAMLDLFPEYGPLLEGQIELAGFPDLVSLKHGPFNDGTLAGTHFKVHADKDATGHHHRHYRFTLRRWPGKNCTRYAASASTSNCADIERFPIC